jgi:hypothetical protein
MIVFNQIRDGAGNLLFQIPEGWDRIFFQKDSILRRMGW